MNSWKQITEIATSLPAGVRLWESSSASDPAQSRLAELARKRPGSKVIELPAERLKQAEALLGSADPLLTRVELESGGASDSVALDLALIEEFCKLFESSKVFENQPSAEAFASLRGRLDAIAARGQPAGAKRPAELVRAALPALIEVLTRLQTLSNDRLYLHPDQVASVAKDRKTIADKFVDLRRREGELADVIRKAPGKEADFVERAANLVDERTALEAEQARLEASYQGTRLVGLLDPRRKPVFDPPLDPANIDVEVLRERRAMLGAKLKSLDEELEKLKPRLPDLGRDPAGSSIRADWWTFNQVLRWNGSKEANAALDRTDLYEFLFGQGVLYTELTREAMAIQTWLQTLIEEYDVQTKTLQEVRDFAKQGNVLLAEKRMSKVARKFKGLGYRRCDEAIQEGKRPLLEAQRIGVEIEEYLGKRKGFLGKMFKDGGTKTQLETRLSAVRGQVAALPKCEIKTAVQDLCTKLEGSLRSA